MPKKCPYMLGEPCIENECVLWDVMMVFENGESKPKWGCIHTLNHVVLKGIPAYP